MENTNHTFAVCAYKESPYLQECIDSLKNQTIPTNIIIATSTPNDYIKDIAEKNGIELFINEGEGGITQDWNFAYSKAKTDYITIAHQDDVYMPEYVENMLSYFLKSKKPLMFFTDYAEIRDGKLVEKNTLLNVKRFLLIPLRSQKMWSSRFAQWFSLAFGTALCCPSVTFYRPNLPDEIFRHHFRACEDWEAWERLYRMKGDFIFCNKILTCHRIHEESETTKILADNKRSEEEYEMFRKFWIKPLALLINKVYSLGQKSNEL